jgi:hypothetical protein
MPAATSSRPLRICCEIVPAQYFSESSRQILMPLPPLLLSNRRGKKATADIAK